MTKKPIRLYLEFFKGDIRRNVKRLHPFIKQNTEHCLMMIQKFEKIRF